MLTVIKRNCNNMDLISTGNKHRFNKQQIIKGKKKMKNWSRLLLCASIRAFRCESECKQSSLLQQREIFSWNHDLFLPAMSFSLFTYTHSLTHLLRSFQVTEVERNSLSLLFVCLLYAKEFKTFLAVHAQQ